MKIKVLMIDDYPMTLMGYETSLIDYSTINEFEIFKAHNSVEALNILRSCAFDPINIVFLDIRLPVSEERGFISGEELGLKIKRKFDTKIIVISSINDQERIKGILQNLEPDSFITKVETTPEVLLTAIETVLNGEKYYCRNVKKILRIYNNKNEYLDTIDQKILHYISQGEKMKNLTKHIPLSLPSIERRKKKIKMYLGINSTSDRELILKAKEKGFL